MSIPKLLALVMIVSTMFAAGVQIDRQRLVATLKHYGLLGRAMVANFVLVPLVSVVLVRLMGVRPDVATGIVLMSMAPGVPFLANSAGRSAGGSLSFAVTLSCLFAALSVVTIPITIDIISWIVPDAPVPPVPIAQFLITLIGFQLVPLVIGVLVAPRLSEPAAHRLVQAMHLLFGVAGVVFLVLIFGTIASSVSKVYGGGNLLVMAAIALFSIGAGWLFGGPDRQYRRTLSIATLMRNVGLCMLIGTGPLFANTLVVPAILAYFVISFVLSLPLRVFYVKSLKARAA